MDDVLELTLLYDFYGELLTQKQRQMFEEYYMDDYSLQEVAENFGVSRQAVSELLARVKRKLYGYEKKIGYIVFHQECKSFVSDLRENHPDIEIPRSINELLQ